MKICQSIDLILELAELDGNTILNVSKSEFMDRVIWMNNQLSLVTRNKIEAEAKGLKYQKIKDKPHLPGCEYFICNECKTVIAFPLKAAM